MVCCHSTKVPVSHNQVDSHSDSMFLNSFPLSDMAEALELQGVAEVSQSSTAALKRSERRKHPSITQRLL